MKQIHRSNRPFALLAVAGTIATSLGLAATPGLAQTTIASSTGALSMSVNNGRVFYLNGNDEFCTFRNQVRSISVAGGVPSILLDEPGCTMDGRYMIVDGAYGFAVGRRGTAYTIERFWSGGLSPDPVQIGTVEGLNPLIGNLATQGDFVYWCTENRIARVRRDGTNPVSATVATAFNRVIAAAANGFVYWGEGGVGAGSIKRVNLDNPGVIETVAGGTLNTPRAAIVDATHIYWTELNGAIKRTTLTPGGAVTTLRGEITGGWSILSFQVDDARLYWNEFQSNGTGRLIRMAKTGGATTQIGPGNLSFVSGLQQDTDQLYWKEGTISNIRRIRKDAAAVTPDFTWLGLEVTQGIQNIASGVPVVQGKPTLVRGYARSTIANYPGVKAQLVGVRTSTGAALPGSPLRSTVPTVTVPTDASITDSRRRNMATTFNWDVPASWLDGDVTLTAQINPDASVTEGVTSNNSFVRAVDVSRIPPICIKARRTRTEVPDISTSSAAFRDAVARLKTLFPARDVWVYPQGGQFEELSCCTWSPPFVYFGAWEVWDDKNKMILQLITEETFSGNPDQCDNAGAPVHRVAMIPEAARTDGLSGYANYAWNVSFVQFDTGGSTAYDRPNGGSTLAQELAHNYNGVFGSRWLHVNCGNPDGINTSYPYATNTIGPNNPLQYYGYDFISRTVIGPTQAKDFMSYCGPTWVSDYNWRGLQSELGLSPLASPPPPPGDYLMAIGLIDETQSQAEITQVFRIPNGTLEASRVTQILAQQAAFTTPAPAFALELRNAAGTVVSSTNFDRLPMSHEEGQTQSAFTMLVQDDPAVTSVTVRNRGTNGAIGVRTASPNAPVISAITSPTAGQAVSNSLTISWNASDVDGDALTYMIQYSHDNGVNWQTLTSNFPLTTYVVPNVLDLPGSPDLFAPNSCRVRVIASDGFRTAYATSATFSVSNRPPVVSIVQPANGARFAAGESIRFVGTANDPEWGIVELVQPGFFTWFIGTGSTGSGYEYNLAEGLPPGTYTIQLLAFDPQLANSGTDAITITVGDTVVTPASTVDTDGDGIVDSLDNCPLIANANQADVDSDGVGDVCDNCSLTANADQGDHDNNGIGNVCDVHVLYVNASATGLNNGRTWDDAFTTIQAALNATVNLPSVEQIWVAAGTYFPTNRSNPADARTARIRLVPNVSILGGFAGFEEEAHEADPIANRTIISGDLNGDDTPNFGNRSDNIQNLIQGNSGVDNYNVTLDGLVIYGGNSVGTSLVGGLYINGNSIIIRRCDFISNMGGDRGGAIFSGFGSSIIEDCRFLGNRANFGGAVRCEGTANVLAAPSFTNCVFSGNSSVSNGGAVFAIQNSPTFLNCTIVGNTSGNQAGGLHLNGDADDACSIVNSILYFNTDASGSPLAAQQVRAVNSLVLNVTYSDVQGGMPGAGNVNLDPQFADANGPDNVFGTPDDSPRPLPGSPVNDAGSSALVVEVTTDQQGSPRRMDDRARTDTGLGPTPIVDMGAYEQPRCRADWNTDNLLNSQDFFDFLNDLFNLNPRADFNFNGAVNSQDFFDFLNQFFAGC